MPTLVLSRRFSDDSNAMWRAAVAAGWDVCRMQSLAPPTDLAARDPVVYAETIVADALAETCDLDFLEPSHDWLPSLPREYLKREVELARLGDVRVPAAPRFIKPVDEKIFPARVYGAGVRLPADAFGDDAPVLVSDPVSFGLEVRVFVLERRIATISAYMREGDIAKNEAGEWPLDASEEKAARAFVEGMLADPRVELPPAVVIDVGEVRAPAAGAASSACAPLGWAVVEANACWAAGVCGCDPNAVLEVVRRANVVRSRLAEVDRRWSRGAHLCF